jgi:hypothetical protein
MKEEQIAKLDELKLNFSDIDYKDGGFYKHLIFYRFDKKQLSIILNPEGKPEEHIDLIQTIINKMHTIMPKDYVYKIFINGWYCDVTNGSLDLKFIDDNYYIKAEHQDMHNKKEIATVIEVANLNNISYSEFKWNILKKKSIDLGFVPVKEKNGLENLYLIEAYKECYPEYNYIFNSESTTLTDIITEPKRKKFLGLF